jgi:hypothetical protein
MGKVVKIAKIAKIAKSCKSCKNCKNSAAEMSKLPFTDRHLGPVL